MTLEDRLRGALRAEADQIDPTDAAWTRVQAEVARRRRTRSWRLAGLGALAAAAVTLVVLAAVSTVGDDDQRLNVGPAGDPEPSVTTTVPVGSEDAQEVLVGIWPFTSTEEVEAYVADPGVGMFFDPEQTALEFAREYLGMPAPESSSGFVATDDGLRGAVAVRPRAGAPMLTRISLWRMRDEGPYVVTAAQTDDIRVAEPGPLALVANPVAVAGESTAYEGTVQFEVRQNGHAYGEYLGRSFFTGGSSGGMDRFAAELTYDLPTSPAGAVVFWTESAEDGAVQQATVVPVLFRSSQSRALTEFSVFFHRGEEELIEVARQVPKTSGVLRAALESLFAGPTEDERDQGIGSLFNESTADLLRDVALRSDGTAVVDIAREVPNANTSAGGKAFLEEMNATVFQFSTVQRIEYRLRGSCEAFWEWMQAGGCELMERDRAS